MTSGRVPWRGIAVLISWFLWPLLFFSSYWVANVMLETGRRCSIEGCDFPEGLWGWLWLAVMLGPPLYLTIRWIRERRSARS